MSTQPKPQSLQEQIIRALSSYSIGAPNIFAPGKWGKPGREPADLVWACNKVCVLIYMTDSSKGQDEHNLRQAKGALRFWRMGHKLEGANDYRSFSLSSGCAKHIVVLSIVDEHCDSLGRKPTTASELGVSQYVTLSQQAFLVLATVGCNLTDIVFFVLGLQANFTPSGVELRSFAKMYLSECASIANLAAKWDFVEPTEESLIRLRKYLGPLLEFRLRMKEHDNKSILNDIIFADSLTLCEEIECHTAAFVGQNLSAIVSVPLRDYDIGICISDFSKRDSRRIAEEAFYRWEIPRNGSRGRPGIRWFLDPLNGVFLAYSVKSTAPSVAEVLLDREQQRP